MKVGGEKTSRLLLPIYVHFAFQRQGFSTGHTLVNSLILTWVKHTAILVNKAQMSSSWVAGK